MLRRFGSGRRITATDPHGVEVSSKCVTARRRVAGVDADLDAIEFASGRARFPSAALERAGLDAICFRAHVLRPGFCTARSDDRDQKCRDC